MKNKLFIVLPLVALILGGYYFYQTKFSDKVKLERCANISLIANQLMGKVSKDLDYRKPLKHKLRYPEFEKVWDDCAYELKNNPIKFNAKYKK